MGASNLILGGWVVGFVIIFTLYEQRLTRRWQRDNTFDPDSLKEFSLQLLICSLWPVLVFATLVMKVSDVRKHNPK